MKKFQPLAAAAMYGLLAAFLSGCNQSVSALETRAPPQPLPSVPLDPVQTSELGPAIPGGSGDGGGPLVIGEDTSVPGGSDQMASLDGGDPTALQPVAEDTTGEPLSREELAGTWIVDSDNPDCRIILAFTKWAGGYRAATRRCESDELGAVTAWDVNGDHVVLVDGSGQMVASLYSTGPERYDGSTAGGLRISFSR